MGPSLRTGQCLAKGSRLQARARPAGHAERVGLHPGAVRRQQRVHPDGLYRRLAFGRHKAPSGPLCPASPCTLRCAARPTTGRRWNNCAATSPARHWPTNGCKPTPQAKWCSSSKPPGATAPPLANVAAGVYSAPGRAGAAIQAAPDQAPRAPAPNAKLRALVVPQGYKVEEQATEAAVAAEREIASSSRSTQTFTRPPSTR
jgi:hypothetical protein